MEQLRTGLQPRSKSATYGGGPVASEFAPQATRYYKDKITTDGQSLVIAPAKSPERARAFKAALDKTNRRYGKALKKLAE